tara:strand:- start:2513 stop:3190 length:678 start_codon:yes stop_codon:yes gene_type:complete
MNEYLLSKSWFTIARAIQTLGLLYLPIGWLLACYWVLYIAPVDQVQGEIYRLIYIHVPSAFMSLGIYAVMCVLGFLFLCWRVKFFDEVSRSIAPIGLAMTIMALITGSLWGKPTWGTYWIWDARLTSELVLAIFYLLFLVLRRQSHPSAKVVAYAVLLIGVIDVPIVHYSVNWWHTLHQGSTVFANHQAIDPSMFWPLIWMVGNFTVITMLLGSLRFTALVRGHL